MQRVRGILMHFSYTSDGGPRKVNKDVKPISVVINAQSIEARC